MRRQNMSFAAIGRRVGVSKGAVAGALWRAKNPAPPAGAREPRPGRLFKKGFSVWLDEETFAEVKEIAGTRGMSAWVREAIEWRLMDGSE